jgi:hypothetical protein
VTLAPGNQSVSAADSSWTLRLSSGTLKPGFGAGDVLVGGLPQGLAAAVAREGTNTIVIKLSGRASLPLATTPVLVVVTVKAGAVTEPGAVDAAPVCVVIQGAGSLGIPGTPSTPGLESARIPNNTVILGSRAYDVSLLNDRSLMSEILAAFVANGNQYLYRPVTGGLVNMVNLPVTASSLPALTYMDAARNTARFKAGDGGVQPYTMIMTIMAAPVPGRLTLTTDVPATLAEISSGVTAPGAPGLTWTVGPDARTFNGTIPAANFNTDYALNVDGTRFLLHENVQPKVRWSPPAVPPL